MARSKQSDRLSTIATDLLCVAAIALLSAAPYVFGLGFYSDDWTLLAAFNDAVQNGRSLTAPALSLFDSRPVQGLYAALLFELFGFEPLPYHLLNTFVIAASVCLLYLLFWRLRFDRFEAFATSLVFLMLPQLSTIRVWYAAFQVPLGLALTLLCLHSQLSFVRTRKSYWLAAAAVSALLAISAYEIFAPLIALFAAGIALVGWWERRNGRQARLRTGAILAAVILSAVAVSAAYKIAVSERTGPVDRPSHYVWILREIFRPDYDWRIDGGLNIFAASLVHFWFTVRGWGEGLIALLSGRLGLHATAAAAAIGALSVWRLLTPNDRLDGWNSGRLMAAGIAVFIAGHATFLIVPSIAFAPTGIGNRVLVAAAIGLAMMFVSAIQFSARLAPPRWRQRAFAIGVAAVAVAAFARIAQIERFWTEAPGLQRQVVDAARSDLRHLPEGSTIILDGVCPYAGPAIVFETWWDVTNALSLALGKSINGDIVTPRLNFSPDGVTSSFYEEQKVHEYGPSLFIYDPGRHSLVPLVDEKAARTYFRTRSVPPCPAGYLGHGVAI